MVIWSAIRNVAEIGINLILRLRQEQRWIRKLSAILFANTIKAAEILKKDKDFAKVLTEKRAKLPPNKIRQAGNYRNGWKLGFDRQRLKTSARFASLRSISIVANQHDWHARTCQIRLRKRWICGVMIRQVGRLAQAFESVGEIAWWWACLQNSGTAFASWAHLPESVWRIHHSNRQNFGGTNSINTNADAESN